MNVSVGPRWEEFVASLVDEGRYGSASEVVREGLRLVEEREARLRALRLTLETSVVEGRAPGAEDARAALAAKAGALSRKGR